MKCKPLRRRYVVFKTAGNANDSEIVSALTRHSPNRGMTRIILRETPYVVVRVDHITAGEAWLRSPMPLDTQGAEILSVSTAGTILKAREKIKKLLRKDNAGDEDAVPVKQNTKMLKK